MSNHMDELRERTGKRLAALKRHRAGVQVETSEERARRQQNRAEQMAQSLTGGRATRGIVKAMLELVVADERAESKEEQSAGPTPGARQVMKPRRKKSKPKPKPAPVCEQGALW